jgi:hypothetical protein
LLSEDSFSTQFSLLIDPACRAGGGSFANVFVQAVRPDEQRGERG